MRILAVLVMFMLGGCAGLEPWIPSFWDDNQAAYITEARLSIEQIRCDQAQAPQVERVHEDLRRFELYSESKGSAQKDVLRVVEPMSKTVNEWQRRGEGSKTYCSIKKALLTQQGQRAAEVILGRW